MKPNGATTRSVAASGFLVVAAGSSANILFLFWLIRSLGADQAGVVVVGIAVQVLLLRVTDCGSMAAIVRFLSSDIFGFGSGSRQTARRVVGIGAVSTATIAVLAGSAMWVVAPSIASIVNDTRATEMTRTLRAVAAAAPIFVVYMNLVHALKGVEAFARFRLIERLARPLAYIVSCLALGVDSPTETMIVLQIVNVLLLVAAAWTLHTSLRVLPDMDGIELIGLREFWQFAAPQGLSSMFDGFLAWSDTILISALISGSAAASYTAVSRVVLLYMFSLDAATEVGAPRFSAAAARGDTHRIRETYDDLSSFQCSIVWPVAVPLFVFLGDLARLVDPSLEAGVGAGRIILLGAMIAAFFGPAPVLLLMVGKPNRVMIGPAIALVCNLLINLLFLSRWGLGVAGLAWSVALVASVGSSAFLMSGVTTPRPNPARGRVRQSLVLSAGVTAFLYLVGFAGGRTVLGVIALLAGGALLLTNLRAHRRVGPSRNQGVTT